MELVILVPLFLILLLLVVAAGRVQDAGVLVTGAARDGARAASLERTPDAAAAAARQVVQDNLAGQALSCAGGPATSVSTSTFGAGGAVQARLDEQVLTAPQGAVDRCGHAALPRPLLRPGQRAG